VPASQAPGGASKRRRPEHSQAALHEVARLADGMMVSPDWLCLNFFREEEEDRLDARRELERLSGEERASFRAKRIRGRAVR
jgi:hypothetical protein